MSDRARVEYHSETFRVDHPAPLRPPSPQNLAEALRRHREGDATPLRSDGDPGWTSLVGTPIGNKGLSEGCPAEQTNGPHPRDALRQALAKRQALSAQMVRLGAEMQAADAAVREAQGRLAAASETARAELAKWADGPRTQPAPFQTEQHKVQLSAIALAENRKLASTQAAYKQAEAVYVEGADDAAKAVADAHAAVCIDIANAIKEQRHRRIIANGADMAVLLGLVKYFKGHGGGQTAANIERALDLTNEWRRALQSQLEEIEQAASEFPENLLTDPDAVLEIRYP